MSYQYEYVYNMIFFNLDKMCVLIKRVKKSKILYKNHDLNSVFSEHFHTGELT